MEIREATKADIPLLSKITFEIQQMHAENVPDFFKMPESEDFAESFHKMMLESENTYIFIAEVDGEAVGSMIAHLRQWKENPFNYTKDVLHIDHISILTDHQGKGYGRALMEHAQKLAEEKGLAYITLSTWGFNTGAQAFYRSLGYETAYIQMWRRLP